MLKELATLADQVHIKDMSNSETKTFIGTTPAGCEWIAYDASKVETMTKRLAALWARHEAKSVRRISKLTRGATEAIAFRDVETMPQGGAIGVTFIEGSQDFLEWCRDALEMRIEDLEANGADEMLMSDLDSVRPMSLGFAEAANARRCKALRKALANLERALES